MSRRSVATGRGTSGNRQAGPAGRHLGAGRKKTALRYVALTLAVVLVGGLVFVVVQVMRLQGNIVTEPLNLNTDQADALPVDMSRDPLQILILGTDTRTGQDAQFGGEDLSAGSGNSDAMMLMHLSADRERVSVISFPRDLLVPIPECFDPKTGTEHPAQELGQLNGALDSGGPGCTVATINDVTGLQIDHFMMADFNAVKELSNTLGGVDVCVNQPVDDPYSGLHLPAGVSSVQGEQALAFLRTRHGFGDGGDAGRIRAQQSFLASMVRKIREEGTLGNLPRVYAIAETITKNLTIDEELADINSLLKIADRLKDVDLSKVKFITAPTKPYEPDPNRLVLDAEQAEPLFEALAEDRALGEAKQTPTGKASPSTSTDAVPPEEPQPEFDPATIPLTVTNASGEEGRSGQISKILSKLGYVQAQTGPTVADSPATQIFYADGYQIVADAVAEELGVAAVQVIPSAGVSGVTVEVGQNFTSGDKLKAGGDLDSELNGQTADQVTCQS
ncbi:LCP family protein [Arthrobacter roseus]|uniref:LCP family protein n=1 Tax=Arthrobacter roseus TaxID=136274 RepID=UPI003083FF05|nr:LCP family protein required for cell wall assembly [Arthrobacter roseus]